MKISFDLDGTAWKYRKEFSALAHILKVSGHEVGILTAHSPDLKDRDIELWLARGFPTPNFYICKEDKRYTDARYKAEAMDIYEIDLHFEDFDSGVYEKQMKKSMEIISPNCAGTVVKIV